MAIRNHARAFKWYHCQWPWRYFKVIRLFDIKFLVNGAWYGKRYYRLLIGSHTRSFDWCYFRWPCRPSSAARQMIQRCRLETTVVIDECCTRWPPQNRRCVVACQRRTMLPRPRVTQGRRWLRPATPRLRRSVMMLFRFCTVHRHVGCRQGPSDAPSRIFWNGTHGIP